jgi:two-component system, chemotaxis family, chemotaxis protein CheY
MSKKIIVIDDSSTIREQVAAALSEAGYQIIEAADGLQGLRVVEENTDAALVICDVNMPIMGGLDMISKVKANGKRPDLPIIVLTTEGDPELIKKAKSAGAKAWIVKPFRRDLLVATVRKLAGAA